MASPMGRRKFLVYGSAAVGTSLLLKACGSAPDTASSPESSPSPVAESPSASPSPSAAGNTIKVQSRHSALPEWNHGD